MLSSVVLLLSASAALGGTTSTRAKEIMASKKEDSVKKLEKETLGPIGAFCKKTNGLAAAPTEQGIMEVYHAAKKDWNDLIDGFDGTKYEEFHKSNHFGNVMRGVFHDCGEFKAGATDTYGCDGCLSDTEANSGLIEDDAIMMDVVEKMWQKHCDKISRADFWSLMGKFAAEKGDKKHRLDVPYAFGRIDNKECTEGADGRLPGHQIGFSEFTRVFVEAMQLTIYETVTLQGGHTYGHVHREHSGFGSRRSQRSLMEHPTTNAWDETPAEFDNEYYESLVNEPWINVQRGDDRSKNFWLVKEKDHELTIMLNADMELAFFSNHDEDHDRAPPGAHIGINGELCATDAIDGEYGCFHKWKNNPGKPGWPETYDQCAEYIEDNELFLKDWEKAYYRMSTVGYKVKGEPVPDDKDTRLGDLYPINLPYYFGELGSESSEELVGGAAS